MGTKSEYAPVFGLYLNPADLRILYDNTALSTVPASQYFEMQARGEGIGEYLPIPDGTTHWKSAWYKNFLVNASVEGEDLYVLANDARFGLTYFHYVFAKDKRLYRYCNDMPYRVVILERRKIPCP